MFLLLHIGSVLILTMAGSLFLFISVVAFIASRQKWDSILFLAWLCFVSTVAFSALCMLTILLLLVYSSDHFHSSFFNIQAKHISFYFLKCSFVVIFPFP